MKVKITKSQLKEWIREALYELEEEEPEKKSTEEPSEDKPEAPSQVNSLDLEDNPFDKENVKESLVKEGAKRIFVKEIQKWMKTLEENRYRKLVNADARRVAWFVNNNMSENYEEMPDSLRKKWSKAAYGKERYLAREFIKSKKNEQKLRESIQYIIKKKVINEGKPEIKWIRHIQISTADPDVIRHDHIDKTFKAIQKVDKKVASQFKKIADKYKKQKETYEAEYNKLKDTSPTKASKAFYDGVSKYTKIGKELIKFMQKNVLHNKK